MRATVTLDDDLLATARGCTGIDRTSDLVREALTALVQREAARRLVRMGGSDPGVEPAPRRRPPPAAPSPDFDVVILDPRLPGWGFPRRGSAGAAGIDLHACLDASLVLEPGAPAALVSAGFAVSIRDPGWCGIVAARSGLGHRGLALGNGMGVIDADYEGPVAVSAWNRNAPGTAPIVVEPGDRIAQLLFTPVAHPELRVVEAFEGGSGRGAGGFGSTGVGARP